MRHQGSWAVRETSGHIATHDWGADTEYEGVVHTPYGTVVVYSYLMQSDSKGRRAQTVRMETAIDGRVHYSWERRRASRIVTPRGLKILAGRWARQVWRDLRCEGGE